MGIHIVFFKLDVQCSKFYTFNHIYPFTEEESHGNSDKFFKIMSSARSLQVVVIESSGLNIHFYLHNAVNIHLIKLLVVFNA